MKKIKIFMLFSILCLLITVAPTFAMDNDTVVAVDNTSQLQSGYYFNENIENDNGNGSADNPYKAWDSDKIPDNSVVYLANGEYRLNKAKTYANLTIIGEDPEKTIISYSNYVGFTSKGLITLKNVTILSLRINLNQNANLTAVNTIFKESSASNSIIYSSNQNYGGNTVILDNCSFYDNYAQYGGAVNLVGGKLNITNSMFANNNAKYRGGAIACDCVEVYMSNCKFINNSATNEAAGAIYLMDSILDAYNLVLFNCSSLFGGSITSLFSDLNLINVTASGNRAKYYGGAIYKMYTAFELSNSTFENNSALNGGALFVDNVADFKINSNYFVNNNASTGGAIYSVLSDSYYDIVDEHLNNTFKNNKANFYEDVYQSEFANLTIGNNEYVLIKYNSSFNGSLPARYDLRELGLVTSVKNQGSGGNCWSFSALAALESSLLKSINVSYDLSEENMKNLMSLYSDYGWVMDTNEGGYDRMAIGYLTSWLGPVNESEDIYDGKSLLSPVLASFMHVQNIVFLKRDNYTDNDAIKKAIIDYGAVSTSLYWSSSFASGKSYYSTETQGANHAVVIVGWDDDYSASNFKTQPQGNGAWIIKNSHGSSSGERGYYYVSYYDTKFAEPGRYTSYAFILNDTIRYDKNYQYDIPGRTDYFLNESATVWYKNKFISSDNEYLAAVSTYFEKDTGWDLFVYVNDELKLTQSGFSQSSYKTIDLDKLIPLNDGDIFEVVFKISVDKEAGVPISESISLNTEMYAENISFISYDGKNWVDFYDLEWQYPDHRYDSQVACIKAFTVLNPINVLINLTAYHIKYDTADIIAYVVDEYGNYIKYGVVTFNVSGVCKNINVNNGVAKLSNVNLKESINKFSAEFNAVGYNTSFKTLFVSKALMNTSISLDISSQYNPVILKATVLDQNNNLVECGEVTFSMDGVNYTVNVVDGVAILNHTFKTFGLKNIYVSFNDLYCYNKSNTNKSIIISNIPTSIKMNIDNQFNPINITARVRDSNENNVNQGVVIFNVDGINYTVNVVDGIASLINTFSIGINSIHANYFDENYFYNSSSCKDSFIVYLKSTNIHLNINPNEVVNNPVNITSTVIDSYNNLVKTGKVVFSVDDENIIVPVVNGKASISHIFKTFGLKDVSARFIDGDYYDSSTASVSFNVSKINVDLSVNVERNVRDVNIYLNFSKKINEYVNVLVNGKRYAIETEDGKAVIKLYNLSNGKYNVNAYINSYIYDSDDQTTSFEVNEIPTNIYCSDEVLYLNNNIYYSVILKDKAGLPVSNHDVKLTIDNKILNAITDSQGKASFKLRLTVGKYNALIEFDGDNYYLKSNSTKLITVETTIVLPSITKYTLNSKYSSKLLDSQGNPLKNENVKIIIDGKEFSIVSDSNGNAVYTIDLNLGSHQITVINPDTGEVKAQTINVVARITGNKDLTMYYGAGSSYKVRIYDDNGNVAKNVEVTFTINGKTYSRFTDSSGYASLKITLNPKTYTIVAKYKGYKVSNKVVVKPTLVCSAKSVKSYKTFSYTVKLLNNKGKILKNKYVHVKFKGKTYKAKTNSKGIATFRLYSSSIGKFTLTATYGSAKISKSITVKK